MTVVDDNRYVIGNNSGLGIGGGIVTTSTQVSLALWQNNFSGTRIRMSEGIQKRTLATSYDQTYTQAFGGGGVAWLSMAIDSSDVVHVLAIADSDQTRDIAYNTFTPGGTGWGTWEQIAPWANGVPTAPGGHISIDSSDVPHVLYVQTLKYHGATHDAIAYSGGGSGSWSAEAEVSNAENVAYYRPSMTHCPADDIEAFYFKTGTGPAYTRRNGSWAAESTYARSTDVIAWPGVICTRGDNVYRYHGPNPGIPRENNVAIGSDSASTVESVAALVSGYRIFFVHHPTSNFYRVYTYHGSEWIGIATMMSSCENLIALNAYNNNPQSAVAKFTANTLTGQRQYGRYLGHRVFNTHV